MKQYYEEPKMEIVAVETGDVITTSTDGPMIPDDDD